MGLWSDSVTDVRSQPSQNGTLQSVYNPDLACLYKSVRGALTTFSLSLDL